MAQNIFQEDGYRSPSSDIQHLASTAYVARNNRQQQQHGHPTDISLARAQSDGIVSLSKHRHWVHASQQNTDHSMYYDQNLSNYRAIRFPSSQEHKHTSSSLQEDDHSVLSGAHTVISSNNIKDQGLETVSSSTEIQLEDGIWNLNTVTMGGVCSIQMQANNNHHHHHHHHQHHCCHHGHEYAGAAGLADCMKKSIQIVGKVTWWLVKKLVVLSAHAVRLSGRIVFLIVAPLLGCVVDILIIIPIYVALAGLQRVVQMFLMAHTRVVLLAVVAGMILALLQRSFITAETVDGLGDDIMITSDNAAEADVNTEVCTCMADEKSQLDIGEDKNEDADDEEDGCGWCYYPEQARYELVIPLPGLPYTNPTVHDAQEVYGRNGGWSLPSVLVEADV